MPEFIPEIAPRLPRRLEIPFAKRRSKLQAAQPSSRSLSRPVARRCCAGNSGTGSNSLGRVMVISGPNTGGKTVALKTVGLSALAAQSGIPVAAERRELPILDRVLADIGDEQSIAADLSTFSAHVLNLKSMLDAATDRIARARRRIGNRHGAGGRRGARRSVA